MGGIQKGLNIANSVADLGMGIYQLWQAYDAYNYAKDVTNRNLDNQAKVYNDLVEGRARSDAGGRVALNQMSTEQRAAFDEENKKKFLKGGI